jgi:hypothetical protein
MQLAYNFKLLRFSFCFDDLFMPVFSLTQCLSKGKYV